MMYYQPAFLTLTDLYHREVNRALLAKPVEFRKKFLRDRLPVGQKLSAELAWPIFREYLDAIENEMASVLRRHSVFFWLHLYRRTGIALSPGHEVGADDERTIELVRRTVELCIFKHGSLSGAPNDVGRSDQISPDRILGGWMNRGLINAGLSKRSAEFRAFVSALANPPQMVISEFSADDFIDLHLVEGLAYQYWRSSALLRSIGKGCKVILNEDGSWAQQDTVEQAFLIASIDLRTAETAWDSSSLGVWFDPKAAPISRPNLPTIDEVMVPVYNTSKIETGPEYWQGMGVELPIKARTNYLPGVFNARHFLDSHSFLDEAFTAQHGYSLSQFICVIWAISNIFNLPPPFFATDHEEDMVKAFGPNLLNTMMRGYRHLEFSSDRLIEEIEHRLPVFSADVPITPEGIAAIISELTLTAQHQADIALWSGGPRFLFIPFGLGDVFDLHALPSLLSNLFVGLSYNPEVRGPAFEEVFRSALKSRGFTVETGVKKAIVGSPRQLDAGVAIGDELFLFECVSIGRPLDYEIGKPATISERNRRLDKKVTQALSLAEFFRACAVGTNFDFRHIRRFVPFVVSPFEEWIWDVSERMWEEDPRQPRILSASEAIKMLEDRRLPPPTTDGAPDS